MTAFDNIKVNNWPATSNEFEDFLVLKLPLNDTAALTESLPVVVGSKTLSAKQTLTNSGVGLEGARVQPDYAATGFTKSTNWRTDFANPEIGLFNGDGTSTQAAVAGNNAEHWFGFAVPLTNVTKVETRMGHDGNQSARAYMGNGTTSYVSTAASATYFTVYSGAATTFSKIGWRSNNGSGASVYDIRITDDTGTYVLTSNENSKKHYDNNAAFASNKYISIPQDTSFDLGTEPFTLECYLLTSDTSTSYPIIIGRWGSGGDSNFNNIWDWRPRADDNGGRWCFRVPDTSGANGIIDGGATVTDGAWHHIAVSRTGNTYRMFTDGQLTNTVTNSLTIPALDGPLNLARGYNTYTGSIQDLRFYKGVAKYTSNFTPPSAILG